MTAEQRPTDTFDGLHADLAAKVGPLFELPADDLSGTRVGPYKLLQRIGTGGFGDVYMADQEEPVRRRVALKIIKLGMDTRQVIARFEAERQALAMMDHPNIAKVLDAGATDAQSPIGAGRPYFVMELVKGEPITTYCDREKLSIAHRLELFTQLCHAVQHAHQKAVIHRDIKPSNVLVSMVDGRHLAKVIDFGIAKATGHRLTEKTLFTEFHQMIGTPQYMSPEQAGGSPDIDTRTDIYSLGVLLYELLTGTPPFDPRQLRSAAYAEMQRIIREVEPPKPSTRLNRSTDTAPSIAATRNTEPKKLGMLLRGELDWIVMKCLEKDRGGRYETASGLAADILRHLSGELVLAGRPSAAHRLKKFVKRNSRTVAVSIVVLITLIVAIVAGSITIVTRVERDEARRARSAEAKQRLLAEQRQAEAVEARDEARARADELDVVIEFQESQLGEIDLELMGARLRRSLIERVADDRRQALEREVSGLNFTSLALETLEQNVFDRYVAAIETGLQDQPLVRARLLQSVADTVRGLGLLDLATEPQNTALALRREILGDEHPDTVSSINSTGLLLQAQGKLTESEPYLREALESRRRALGDDHPDTLTSISDMGALVHARGKYDEALEYYREALEGKRRVLGDDHPGTLGSINNIGMLLESMLRFEEAQSYLRKALAGHRRVLGDDQPNTLTSISNMGVLLGAMGKLAEAEPYLREALESRRRALGDDHPDTLTSISNMGVLLEAMGKLVEAERYHHESLAAHRRVLGDDHPNTLASISNLGMFLRTRGELDQAESLFREALAGYRRVLGNDHPITLRSVSNLAGLLHAQGKFAQAEPLFRAALEESPRAFSDDHPYVADSLALFGSLLRDQGRLADSGEFLRARDQLVEPGSYGPDQGALLAAVVAGSNAASAGLSRGDVLLSYAGHELPGPDALGSAIAAVNKAVESGQRAGDEPVEVVYWQNGKILTAVLLPGRMGVRVHRGSATDGLRAQRMFDLIIESEGVGAESLLRAALEMNQRLFGHDHPEVSRNLSDLGAVVRDDGRYAEAEPLLREALETQRRILGEQHPALQATVRKLIDLYAAWHAAEPGKGYAAKAAAWRAVLDGIEGSGDPGIEEEEPASQPAEVPTEQHDSGGEQR